MNAIPKRKLTPEEYLEIERKAEYKSEYFDGEIYAMAGAKRRHNVIAWNVGGELRQHLKGKNCEAYPADMRVFVPQTGLYTYPDLVVVCGEPKFQDDTFDTLLNPILIVEVLSDTTENYDRGKKFQHYRSIESLHEYVLVSQDEARIEKYVKRSDGFWLLSEAVGLDLEIEFASIECRISLAEVYDKIDFSDE
ncbi:MAG TPA: Uma2 family endonuclease [Pyrinomonadaceae bacterium]|jgi:Uma2 family endonuclease|nr:Uma2 family endonuclease [Pyrinomonadaceae bacterium]